MARVSKSLAVASALRQAKLTGVALVRLHSAKIFATKTAKTSDDVTIVTGGVGKDQSVAIHGRITVSNSGEMRTALANALHTKPTSLSVDQSGVSFLDTSGLATLIEAARTAREQGTRLALQGLHDQPLYFFEIAHLEQLFDTAGLEASK